MDRRKFLRGAVAVAALPVVAPLAPAVPPLAFNMLPPIVPMPPAPSITGTGIMLEYKNAVRVAAGNRFLTVDQFAAEALRILRAPNIVMASIEADYEGADL